MILMTLNCRGLASYPKKLALKRLIEEHSLDVVYLQETMCDGCVLVKDWNLCLKNGSLSLWTPRVDLGDFLWVGGLETFF